MITRALNAFGEYTGRAVSWLALALVLLTAWDVFARYVFKAGSVALQEMEWHIFSAMFLTAAAWTLKNDGHVRVDIFYAKMSSRGKAVVDFLGAVFFLLPFCALIIYTSLGFVENSWAVRESSGDPGGLSARYILKAMIPLGFFMLALQGVSLAISSFLNMLKKPAGPEPEVHKGGGGV